MNDQIYGMASDYDGFIDDPASNAVLCQIQSLNAQILEILARKHFPSPSSTTNNSDAKPQTTAKPKSSTADSTFHRHRRRQTTATPNRKPPQNPNRRPQIALSIAIVDDKQQRRQTANHRKTQ